MRRATSAFLLATAFSLLTAPERTDAAECNLATSIDLDPNAIHIDSDGTGMCRDGHDRLIADKDGSREHARAVLRRIRDRHDRDPQHKTRIVLYVHGALNTLDSSSSDARTLAEAIDADADQHGRTYAVSINWQSSLAGAYLDHLGRTRQGKQASKGRGWLTSPFVFASDTLGVIGAVPRTWLYQAAIPLSVWTGWGNLDEIDDSHREWRSLYTAAPAVSLRVERTGDSPDVAAGSRVATWANYAWKVPLGLATAPVQLLAAPVVTSFGSSAWTSFQRRTFNMFRRPRDLMRGHAIDERTQRGALAIFMDLLVQELGGPGKPRQEQLEQLDAGYEIVLIGHSTGAIVLNNLVLLYPDVPYSQIVYMAAASSIQDTLTSVVPYLARHPDTHFSVLTLACEAERLEQSCYGACSYGSLLEWIDAYFTSPAQELDRVLGKWENVIRYAAVFPNAVRRQITLKKFAWREAGTPQTHGAFNDVLKDRAGFWSAAFSEVADPTTETASAHE